MRVAIVSVMLAIAQSAALVGLTSFAVRVEVEVERGVPGFELVGLAEAAVRETRVRVKSAIPSAGGNVSEHRVTVNLAPADLRKTGSGYDLAIAVATLVATGVVPAAALEGVCFLGELSLSGAVQRLRGVIAHLVAFKERGVRRVILPRGNEREASLFEGVDVALAGSLAEVVEDLRGNAALPRPRMAKWSDTPRAPADDLADIRGQYGARRMLELAAAGNHNLLMMGPPGAGKTMLARRLPGILPLLSRDEAVEVIAIHGIAGPEPTLFVERPFRAPHHTTSEVALVGGGEHARPGEVSLAHHGVLFLDELGELRRAALEALRQPIEDGVVTVCRTRHTATFPARPMVVGATNPCPCGSYGDGTDRCNCGIEDIRRYRNRLSGPILDRLDIHVLLPRVDLAELQQKASGESSVTVRARVEKARAIQRARYEAKETTALTNAQLPQRDLEHVCRLDLAGRSLLASAVERRGLSARAYGKVLRVARTIADLEGATAITAAHVGEAITGRVLDRDPSNGRPAAA